MKKLLLLIVLCAAASACEPAYKPSIEPTEGITLEIDVLKLLGRTKPNADGIAPSEWGCDIDDPECPPRP